MPASKSIIYSRQCFCCLKTKESRVWFKSSREGKYACQPCISIYARKLETDLAKALSIIGSLKQKNSELKAEIEDNEV